MTRMKISPAITGAAMMMTAGAAFAIVNVAIQGATMLSGASPGAVVFWQYLIAFVVCLPVLSIRKTLRTLNWHWHLRRVALAAIGVQFWTYGLAYVPIWQAIALILLSPVFVTFGAGAILREPVSVARWAAVLMGMFGGVILLSPWSDAFDATALFPVLAALFWAASSLVTKKLALTEDAGTLTIWLLMLLLPVNFMLALDEGLDVSGWPLILLAGIATAAAQFLLAAAYRRSDAAYLQPFDHLKLPFNIGLGYLAFGFAPDGMLWLGVALIATSGLMLMWSEARKPHPMSSPGREKAL